MEPLSLNEVRQMERDMLTPDIVSRVVGCSPMTLRLTARQFPERLGFPVIVMGSRVRVPREAFIKFMEGAAEG